MNATIPQWLLEKKEVFMSDEDSVRFDILDLGRCRIDVYREPGDLCDSWDISPEREGAIPDARYGTALKGDDDCLGCFPLLHLYEVYTVYNRNGHDERRTEIYDFNGRCIVSRGN